MIISHDMHTRMQADSRAWNISHQKPAMDTVIYSISFRPDSLPNSYLFHCVQLFSGRIPCLQELPYQANGCINSACKPMPLK